MTPACRSWIVALALTVAPSAVLAQSPRQIDEEHPGYRDYRSYCGACHGIDANGDGPVASALTTPPADLTRLGERYGMPLPRSKLLPFVDGRDAKRAHGTREMPVWGKVLHQDQAGSTEREMIVRGTILVILDYLETIQVQETDPAP
jgi:mono/diheme cytochrome c family protein